MERLRWQIPVADLGKFEAALGRELKQIIKQNDEKLAKEGVKILRRMTRAARPANPSGVGGPPIFSGRFFRGWKVVRKGQLIMTTTEAPYASVIESGRRRGRPQPPTDALVPWVIRRLGVSARRARSVAFLVARAIRRRGLLGRHIARDSLPKIRMMHKLALMADLDRALTKAARQK